MLVEYEDDSGTNYVKRAYTWGLDLSQNSLDGAGGIGGLLSLEDRNATATTADDVPYFVMYDTHGNVGQIVGCEDDYGSASGAGWHTDRLAARYEYDAFGIVVGPDDDSDDNWRDDAGSYASDNPIRFSTKYFDDEAAPDQGAGGSAIGLSSPFAATQGLGYWGLRFYDPRRGRWTGKWHSIERLRAVPLPSVKTSAVTCFLQVAAQPGVDDSCTCPRTYYIDCATGLCVPGDPTSVYGNCCGAKRRCESGGCVDPIPGDCLDESCAAHDQCLSGLSDKKSVGECDCELACRAMDCGIVNPGQAAAADLVRAGMCLKMLVAGIDCPCCFYWE